LTIVRKAIAIGLVLIVVDCCAQGRPNGAAQESDPRPDFSIVIGAPIPTFRLTEPVTVKITVTNDTNHTIGWESLFTTDPQYACTAFRYDLERNGKEVETTLFHRQFDLSRLRPDDPIEIGRLRADSILTLHPPGKMFEIKLDLKCLYQISEPGNYTLQVSRYDRVAKATVKSNTLTLEIEH
jgi:hypothetical protein